MTTAILLLGLAACFPRMDLSGGGEDVGDGGGVGEDGGDGSGDGGGAGGGGDDGASGGGEGGGDDGTTVPAPSLSSASPEHGSNAGGRRVRITGADLGADTRVWFGDREATVVSATDTTVDVDVPAAPGVVGPVTVRVETEGGEDAKASAFQYWEDASGDAITVVRARAIEGWDGGGDWTSFQALGWNTTPADVWSTDTQAAMSTCTATYSSSDAVEAPDELWLDGDLGELDLDRIPDSEAFLADEDWPSVDDASGTRHDVHLTGGGAWPAYTVDDGLAFPDALELYTPSPWDYETYEIDDFVVEWEAWGADRMLIGFFDYSSDALVICAVDDTSEFTVPDTTYNSFVPSEDEWWGQAWVMQVVVLAYKDTASVLEFNNGELRAQGGVGYATWVRVEDSWF